MIGRVTERAFNVANSASHYFGIRKWLGIKKYSPTILGHTARLLIRPPIPPMSEVRGNPSTEEKALLMMDHIIQHLRQDPNERQTAEIIEEAKENFKANRNIFNDSFPTGVDKQSFFIPCACEYAVNKAEKTLTNISIRLNATSIESFWKNKGNPYMLTLFASNLLKEGVYIYLFNHNCEYLKEIAVSSVLDLKELENKGNDTSAGEDDNNTDELFECCRKCLAMSTHMEYLGYKERFEFLFRHGINAYSALALAGSKLIPQDELTRLGFIDTGGRMRAVNNDGTVNEKKAKKHIIRIEIISGHSQVPDSALGSATLAYGFLRMLILLKHIDSIRNSNDERELIIDSILDVQL